MSERMMEVGSPGSEASVEKIEVNREIDRLPEQRAFLFETLDFSSEMRMYLERFPEARDFLVQRLFDRGLNRKLEPAQLQDGFDVPEAAVFFGEREVPLVLNSFCRPLLGDAGYTRRMGFDLGGVFAANELPTTREKAGGDFLIRNAVAALGSYLDSNGYVLMRVGGDEFEIWQKGEGDPVGTSEEAKAQWKQDRQEELDEQLGKELSLYYEENQVVVQPIKAAVKDLLPGHTKQINPEMSGVTTREAAQRLAMARLQYPQLVDEILLQHFEGYGAVETLQLVEAFEDFKRLTAHHKEFQELWNDLLAALTVPEVAPMVELFATVLEDPLLKAEAERLNVAGRDISVHHDMLDWLHHATWKATSGQVAQLTVLKVEVPGLLKQFNDEAQDGYAKGDQFLIEHFGRLAETLERELSALELPSAVQVWRRGGDFYVALPDLEHIGRRLDGTLRNRTGPVTPEQVKQWLVGWVEAGVAPAEPVRYADKNGHEAEAVVLPVAVVVERQFMPQVSPSKFFPSDSARLVWREMLDEFDREAVPQRVYKRLVEALRDPNISDRVAKMMREVYFSPEGKRGKGRLARLKLTDSERLVMKSFLTDGSRREELCAILGDRVVKTAEVKK